MKTAAIYARVSSDKQREENTIASQTAALVAFAREQHFDVPQEWIFEDDGYSGASLIRPGLERVRDLAAEGLIQAVLVYAPDRLSRRYAHQILLIEELARAGVETLFVRTPRGSTPEDELLVQFQGMIAEYERAQILERSRRGKRHRARQGEVSVLSGAPFGYRFIRKTEHSAAHYEINEEQAPIVRRLFALYTAQGLSIGALARLLNEQHVPTCKQRGRWERSTVWGMLRNPAYKGEACFGKTMIAPRQRITRPLRMRGGASSRNSASHERPRGEWIAIAVPPIVSEETFALAQERLEANKTYAPRRTITPSLVQGLVSCSKCGYALYRTSTRSSARKIYYYRCLGSDAYRRLGEFICDNKPVRQDLLDEIVWAQVVRLLEDPQLIQSEIDRRLAAARKADPTKRHEEALRRQLVRLRKGIDRLLTAYQEGLLSLEELRQRMPALRRREQANNAELQAIVNQLVGRAAYLRLADTLTTFLARLRTSADTLDVSERQRILRLLVKDVLVGDDKIIIRHCIPMPTGRGPSAEGGSATIPGTGSYLLRPRSHHTTLRGAASSFYKYPILHHGSFQPSFDVEPRPCALDVLVNRLEQKIVRKIVEQPFDVKLQNPIIFPASLARDSDRIQSRFARSVAVGV
jgi:site-specific DNA recombinase